MSRRIKAFLLAASAAAALPVVATPANAFPIDEGCGFTAVRDVTDEQGQQTWIELTYSYFVGTPDVTSFETTCWLQTDANQGVGELANTRHTCSGAAPAGACANPVVFEINASDNVYFCQHIEWTGSATNDPTLLPGDLIDDVLRDIFSTGGATTMGGANQIAATVALAVDNLIATLTGTGVPGLPGPPTTHTTITDNDTSIPGIQCANVISA